MTKSHDSSGNTDVTSNLELLVTPKSSVPAKTNHQRTCLLVLGMHRSGTSVLTRMMSIAGAKLPKSLLGKNESNETGHWESASLLEYFESLLSELGSSWEDWRNLDTTQLSEKRRQEIKIEIMDIIKNEFLDAPLFILKDPRICRFPALVMDALTEANINIRIIIPFRNPLEVCDSLNRRDQMSQTEASLLWIRHVLVAERSTRNQQRVFVSNDNLLTNWQDEFSKICQELGIRDIYNISEIKQQIETYISPKYHHHTYKTEDVLLDSLMKNWAGEVYEALLILMTNPSSVKAIPALDNVFNQFEPSSAFISQILTIQRNEQQNKVESLHQLNSSSEEKVARLAQEKQALENSIAKQNHQSKNQVRSLTVSLEKKSHEINEALLRQQDANLTIKELKQSVLDKESEKIKAISNYKNSSRKSEEQKAEINHLKSKLREVESVKKELTDSLLTLKNINSNIEFELKLFSKKLSNKKKDYDQLNKSFNSLELKLNSEREKTESLEIKQLKDRVLILEAKKNQGNNLQFNKTTQAISKSFPRTTQQLHRVKTWFWWAITLQAPKKILTLKRLRSSIKQINSSGLFDSDWYLENNLDVKLANTDPAEHFVTHGWKEKRSPSIFFDLNWYLQQNPDVAQAGVNPLIHYLEYGAKEGRLPSPPATSPSPEKLILNKEKTTNLVTESQSQSTNTNAHKAGSSVPHIVARVAKKAVDKAFGNEASGLSKQSSHIKKFIDFPSQAIQKNKKPIDLFRLQITFVIPDFQPGAGGHMTIFRIAHFLEKFGHQITFLIQNPSRHRDSEHASETIRKYFVPLEAKFQFINGNLPLLTGDALIATDRYTCYPVKAMTGFRRKFYFVQDYETMFYSTGTESLLTENTYNMGFDCLCAGEWLASLMHETYNLWSCSWPLAYDPDYYYKDNLTPRKNNRIAFYARYVTPRRAVELGIMALEILHQRGVEFHVDFFGWDVGNMNVDYSYTDHGILSSDALGKLYRQSTIGVVFSATNHSLVNKEMMSCGLPVVDLDTPSVRGIFPVNTLQMVLPNPSSIADGLEELLSNPGKQNKLAKNGYQFIKDISWEQSAKIIEKALLERVTIIDEQ